jgi:lysophospholipid acyltransferase (LPLAT)-like uncharacterized protein
MKPWQIRVAAGAGGRMITALLGTATFETEGEENFLRFQREGRPVVFVLWHGHLLPLSYHHRHQGIATLVSRSADGEIIARIVESWGYTTVRGSSSRGGSAAIRPLARHLRAGRTVAITPDGPRGPRQKMKPGALRIAQLGGAPIIPIVGAASRGWWAAGGWDRFLIPKPFARLRLAYGEPHFVPARADDMELARIAGEVEAALNELAARTEGADVVSHP